MVISNRIILCANGSIEKSAGSDFYPSHNNNNNNNKIG